MKNTPANVPPPWQETYCEAPRPHMIQTPSGHMRKNLEKFLLDKHTVQRKFVREEQDTAKVEGKLYSSLILPSG